MTLTSCGCKYNLDIMRCTSINLQLKMLKMDGAKLLARFLAVPEVLGQIKLLKLRFVLTAVDNLQFSSCWLLRLVKIYIQILE